MHMLAVQPAKYLASDLVCKRSRSGISPLALAKKGMVSLEGSLAVTQVGVGEDPEWPESYRSLQQFHSSTNPFGEAIGTCAAAAL